VDAKLRLLLRRYSASKAPADATAFANESLRAGSVVPEIWVVDYFNGEDSQGSDISLFYSETNAWKYAGLLAERIMNDAHLVDEDQLSLLEHIQVANASENYQGAAIMFDRYACGAASLNVYSMTMEDET